MNVLNEKTIFRDVMESPELRRLQDISFLGILGCFSDVRNFSSRYDHSLSVANKCYQYAKRKNYSKEKLIYIVLAGLLHDIGHCCFSHTLEPVFKDLFSITHHDMSKQLILFSPNLIDIWNKYNIDADKIVDIIEGNDNDNKVVAKMCINFDTLDGIARAEGHFVNTDHALKVCNKVFDIMCNENNWEKYAPDFDAFWNLKNSIYNSYIYNGNYRILERIFQELFIKEKFLSMDHFYLTDTELQYEFPWMSRFINDMKNDFSTGFITEIIEKIKEIRDVAETSLRRFEINFNKNFSVQKNKRYSVLEEIRPSYI